MTTVEPKSISQMVATSRRCYVGMTYMEDPLEVAGYSDSYIFDMQLGQQLAHIVE